MYSECQRRDAATVRFRSRLTDRAHRTRMFQASSAGRKMSRCCWWAGQYAGGAIGEPTRAFAVALGHTAKTDAIDATVLAQFGVRVRPAVRPIADADTHALAALVARRRQLLEMPTAERQRLEQAATTAVRRSVRQHVQWLERRVSNGRRQRQDDRTQPRVARP